MLARFDEACKHEDVVLGLFLADCLFLLSQRLTSLDFPGNRSLRQVADEHLILRERKIFFESGLPVLLCHGPDLFAEDTFHSLGDLQHSFHGFLTLLAQVFPDFLLVEEEVEHGDFSHGDDLVFGDTAKHERVVFVLHQEQVFLVQVVQLFHLIDAFLVCDQSVVLMPIFAAEKDDAVLPVVADPTLAALHPGPFGLCVHFKVRVL